MFDEYDKEKLVKAYRELLGVYGYYYGLHGKSVDRLNTIVTKLEELMKLEGIDYYS